MKQWGVPSGGDWGLYRGGAIFIEGAENVSVSFSTFTRIDGNGIFVSGYTRNVTIADNEFSWIGDSPMAAWGYTNGRSLSFFLLSFFLLFFLALLSSSSLIPTCCYTYIRYRWHWRRPTVVYVCRAQLRS